MLAPEEQEFVLSSVGLYSLAAIQKATCVMKTSQAISRVNVELVPKVSENFSVSINRDSL
jgi:hypothetical protein